MSHSGRVPLLKNNQTQRPEQRLDIYVKMRHKNTLPEAPMEPRFLQLPFMKLSRFAEYKTTQLEKNYRFQLAAERDLDINVDLVDPKRYIADTTEGSMIPENMDPIDQYLVEEEVKTTDKRRESHNEVVSWMRKLQYLGVENATFGVRVDRKETKVGHQLFQSGKKDRIYKDHKAQIDAINKTFDDVNNIPSKHPLKKGVYVVEELPLLPDFDFWHLPFSQVIFDSDPIPVKSKKKEQIMEHAVIRGLTDEQGESFVAYYAPTEDTLDKVLENEKADELPDHVERLEYAIGKEYTSAMRTAPMKGFEPDYFFSFRGGKAYYNWMDTRVKLTRKAQSAIADTMLVRNDEVSGTDKLVFETRLLQLSEREFVDETANEEKPIDDNNDEEDGENLKKSNANEMFGAASDDESSSSSSSSNDSDSDEEKECDKKVKKSSNGDSKSSIFSDDDAKGDK